MKQNRLNFFETVMLLAVAGEGRTVNQILREAGSKEIREAKQLARIARKAIGGSAVSRTRRGR